MVRRPTVLIEHPGSLVLLDHREQLEAAGYEVVTCRGPRSLPDGTCPLVTSGDCPLAARADVIVNALGVEDLQVYSAERTLLPDVPVCLACSEEDGARIADTLAASRIVPATIGGEELVKVVAESLNASRAVDRPEDDSPAE